MTKAYFLQLETETKLLINILLLLILNTASMAALAFSRNDDLLRRINAAAVPMNANPARSFKETIAFLNKLDGFDSGSVCPSLSESEFQLRLSMLTSITSTCTSPTGFCKLAMQQDGSVYGAQESNFDSNYYY